MLIKADLCKRQYHRVKELFTTSSPPEPRYKSLYVQTDSVDSIAVQTQTAPALPVIHIER